MTGCAKCRHSAHGCARCNPQRFTFRSRCSRKAKVNVFKAEHATECAQAFRAWLVASHGLTDGSARDYAWAFKCLLINKGSVARGSPKLQSVTNVAKSKIDAFVRTPQFVKAGQAKKGNAEGSSASCSTSGKSKVLRTVGKASKVQGSCTPIATDKNGKSFAKRLRVMARPLLRRRSSEVATNVTSDNAAVNAKAAVYDMVVTKALRKLPVKRFRSALASQKAKRARASTGVAENDHVPLQDHGAADADAGVAEVSLSHDSGHGDTEPDLFSECFPSDASSCDVPPQLDVAAGSEDRPNHEEPSVATEASEVDPEVALVVDSVKNAGHLSQQCSAMLASMLPFSLCIPVDERLDGQHKVVSMAEETLRVVQAELETAASAADAKSESLETTIAELEKTVKDADAEFAAWSARWRVSLDDASAVANNSARTFDERREAQAQGDVRLVSLREDITALEKAFRAHFQKPMKSGKGPQFQELEPFLQNLEVEQSMLRALPKICKKEQANRSDEEHAILENLEMAIAVKISTLTETVAAETLAAAERAAAVKNAEMEYSSTKQDLDLATSDFQASMKERGGGQEFLKKGFKAKEAMKELRSQLEAAAGLRDFARTKLADLTSERGPLAIFMTLKTKGSMDAALLHELGPDMVDV